MNGPCLLDELVGSELASVVFIRDYVQFVFEGDPGGILSAYATVVCRGPGVEVSEGSPGYADALRALIDGRVAAAKCGATSLDVAFDGGARITISLAEEDRVGPEAAMLQLEGGSWSLW